MSSAEELSKMITVVACAGGCRLCLGGSAHGVEHGGSSFDMDNAATIHRVLISWRSIAGKVSENKICRMEGKYCNVLANLPGGPRLDAQARTLHPFLASSAGKSGLSSPWHELIPQERSSPPDHEVMISPMCWSNHARSSEGAPAAVRWVHY